MLYSDSCADYNNVKGALIDMLLQAGVLKILRHFR